MPELKPYGDNLPPTLSLAMAWRCPVHPHSQEVWLRRFNRPAPHCKHEDINRFRRPVREVCGMEMQRVDPDQLRDTL